MTPQEIIQSQPNHSIQHVENHPLLKDKHQIWLPNNSWHLFDTIDPIIQAVRDQVQSDSMVIVNSDSEALFWGQINLLQVLLKEIDLPDNQFCFISSAMPNARTRQRFLDLVPNPDVNLFCVSTWQSAAFDSNPLGSTVANTDPGRKSKLFNCFNNGAKPHRYGIVSELIQAGLFNRGYISLRMEPENANNSGAIDEVFPDLAPRWRNTWKNKAHMLPLEINYSVQTFFEILPEDVKMLNSSYFSIITETLYMNSHNSMRDQYGSEPSYSSDFATEKTYRTIRACHPAIWVTTPRFLESLRELGFQTFSPWIDESYDQIEDDQERMQAIVTEIRRLNRQPYREWQQWQAGVKPVLEHNVKHLQKFRHLCIHHTDFDNYITQLNTEDAK